MGDFKQSVALSKLDHKHSMRQRKKDDQFAPPVHFTKREMSAEEIRRERDCKYLEENFPDLGKEKIIGVDDL